MLNFNSSVVQGGMMKSKFEVYENRRLFGDRCATKPWWCFSAIWFVREKEAPI
jgi:hypothetical protein